MARFPTKLASIAVVGTVLGAILGWLRFRQQADPIPAPAPAPEPEPHVPYIELTPEELHPETLHSEEPADETAAEEAVEPRGHRWVHPIDGMCPESHPIKARFATGHYHRPEDRGYEKITPDSCYATTEDAEADGFSPARS